MTVVADRPDPWSVDPPDEGPPQRRSTSLRSLLAWLLGAVPACLQLWWDGGRDAEAVAVLAGVALVWAAALRLVPWHRWTVAALAAVAGAAALLLGPVVGVTPLLVSLAAVAAGHAALVGWQPAPAWTDPVRPTATLALPPLVAAGVVWARSAARIPTAALLLASFALVGLHHRRPHAAAAAERALTRAAVGAGKLLSGAVVGAVTFVLFWLPGLVTTPVQRWRRRRATSDGRSNWRTRRLGHADERADASRPFAAAEAGTRAARNGVAALSVALAVVLVVVVGRSGPGPTTPPEGPADGPRATVPMGQPDPAFEGRPWEAMLRIEAGAVYRYEPSGGFRVADVASRWVNIEDGERRTRAPDASLGEPIEVWFFGGSAAFGAGQRDLHTIPSELVTAAERADIPLLVRNFGVPATTNWQSVIRYAYLSQWREPPDLVVFYDGFNDFFGQIYLDAAGQGASDEPTSNFSGEFDEALGAGRTELPPELGPVELRTTTTSTPSADAELLSGAVLRRYARGIGLAREVAGADDVPVVALWQPSLVTKSRRTDAETALLDDQRLQGGALELAEGMHDLVAPQLPELGVRDLGDALDDPGGPVYLDVVHTNERGARLVAERILAELMPTLERLR